MIWAVATLAAFALCAAKYLTRRSGNHALDKAFLRIHTVAGVILPLAALVRAVKQRDEKAGTGELVSWLCVCLGISGLMGSHFFAKKLGRHAMPLHRFFTVFTGVSLAAHFVKCLICGARKKAEIGK